VTQQVTADATGRWLREFASVLRRPSVGRLIARTAGYNVASVAAAGLGGIIVARALGPEIRGEYAAVTAWFGVATMVGGMGQPAALCFHVAHDPGNARGYVATSRAMMLVTGTAAMAGGMILAPLLAHGNAELTIAYRIVFATSIVAFVSASYTFSLQARNLRWWNTVRVSQPVLSLAFLVVLWRLHMLTLTAALIVLALTMSLQLGWAYYRCRSAGLAPGRAQARLVRPLARYGVAQIAALTPATLNANLDQLVLSQAVPPAVLGRYAIAVSCTLLPIPLVSAIGNVAFPRLASRQRVDGLVHRMQWLGILGAACGATVALVPLDLVAPWLIPRVFGPRYIGVVPLLWMLTPAGIFLACNQVMGDMLRGRKRPQVVARAEGLAAIFTVILLVALLPVVGVYGAAIASLVAYGVALVMMLLSLRRLPSDSSGTLRGRHRAEKTRLKERRDVCRPRDRGARHGPHLPSHRTTHRRPNRPLCPVARALTTRMTCQPTASQPCSAGSSCSRRRESRFMWRTWVPTLAAGRNQCWARPRRRAV
jgi:O-antigen/teichoic acid export membrane protein